MLTIVLVLTAPAGRGSDGIIVRAGRHIELTTDLADTAQAESLVESFDAAVPQWFDFWNLPAENRDDWKVRAFVMRQPERFRAAGLIPDRVPDFKYGHALGKSLWVIEQPGSYYTRHLLLHEGVHALAFDQFGGAGPSWFMEGTAELLATHHGSGSSTTVGIVPRSKEQVPYWGRFKLIGQRRDQSSIPTVESIMRLPRRLAGDPESYGWSWALAMLLHRYPEYQDAFYAAARNGRDSGTGFTRQLYLRLQSQWPVLVARWRVLCHELDYGYQWRRERVELSTRDPVWQGEPAELDVEADRGWQSAAVRFPAGSAIKISAEGRVVVAETSQPWTSDPSGVTLRYHRGKPLGQLLYCTVPCRSEVQPVYPSLETHAVVETDDLRFAESSWLLFRVNDDVAELDDNGASYRVTVSAD